jgi:hypothetical protein
VRGEIKVKKLIVAALLGAASISAPAAAATITYTLSGTFTGTLDGNFFSTDAVFTGVADTNGPQTYGQEFHDLTSLKAVAGGVTYNSVNTGYLYTYPNFGSAGFGTLTNGYFVAFNGAFGFDGVSNYAPTPVTGFGAVNQAFVTDKGTAYINTATNLTFSASLAGAVPEPATWAMMIGGIGMVGGAMRRRRVSATVSFA